MPAPTLVVLTPVFTLKPPAPLYEVEWFSASTSTEIVLFWSAFSIVEFSTLATTSFFNTSVLKEPPAATESFKALFGSLVAAPTPIAT